MDDQHTIRISDKNPIPTATSVASGTMGTASLPTFDISRAIQTRLAPTRTGAAAAIKALQVVVDSGVLVSWTDTSELQLACLTLCETCRQYIPAGIKVLKNTPRAVWADDVRRRGGRNFQKESRGGCNTAVETGVECDSEDGNPTTYHAGVISSGGSGSSIRDGSLAFANGGKSAGDGHIKGSKKRDHGGERHTHPLEKRVPLVKITRLVWERPAKDIHNGSVLPSTLTELTFGRGFNMKLDGFQWPPNLERLTFGSKFNRSIAWPVAGTRGRGGRTSADGKLAVSAIESRRNGEETLCGDGSAFKSRSRDHVDCSKLPRSLTQVTFGKHFNKPLPAHLPPRLVSLTLGRNFCRPLSTSGASMPMSWPAGLESVKLGSAMLRRWQRDELAGPAASTWPERFDSLLRSVLGFHCWPAGLDRIELWGEGWCGSPEDGIAAALILRNS